MTNTASLARLSLGFIVAVGAAGAQQKSDQAPNSTSNPSQFLKIYVLDGHRAINSIPQRKVTIPVVEVRDENDLPVDRAEVTFKLPEGGPGGTFQDGKHIRTVLTNLQGQANAPFFINPLAGRFVISVTGHKLNRAGEATIEQTNSALPIEEPTVKQGKRWFKNWKVLAVVGAAATVGAVALARGGGSSSSSPTVIPTIVISPGSPSLGGPR